MKTKSFFLNILMFVLSSAIVNSAMAAGPANPNATPEARALLRFIYSISGKYTLTGQHNYPDTKDKNSRFAFQYTGQTPVIWSSDMGFAKQGDKDSYLARADIVREAIRQHKQGSIITICWHAVPPTAKEPVTFMPQGKADTDSLASVQGHLTDKEFKELLTPGTKMYKQWARQVDSVAVYLKKLQDARVPVLWRPYHEMNGDWFWWGGRVGKYGTADLYRQIYDRLVNVHKLNNLIWVWSIDRPSTPIRKFSNFYPGNEYLDILALDVYGSDFSKAYYDSLMVLSKGKPVTLGEVGNPPSAEILKEQPNWSYWIIWAGMVRNTTKKEYHQLFDDPALLSLEDSAYQRLILPYRKACNLEPLPLPEKYPPYFSGKWIFNESKSEVGAGGTGSIPEVLTADQDVEILRVKKLMSEEWGDDRTVVEEILVDGTEMKSEFYNTPRISKAIWNGNTKTLNITSIVKINRNGNTVEIKSNEEWSLGADDRILKIVQTSTGFDGRENKLILIYDKL